MLAERPIRILRSLGSLNKGREVARGRGEKEKKKQLFSPGLY